MKCRVCGNEIGNAPYCGACGTQVPSYQSNNICGQTSGMGTQNAVSRPMNAGPEVASNVGPGVVSNVAPGTTVLSSDEMDEITQPTYMNNMQGSHSVQRNLVDERGNTILYGDISGRIIADDLDQAYMQPSDKKKKKAATTSTNEGGATAGEDTPNTNVSGKESSSRQKRGSDTGKTVAIIILSVVSLGLLIALICVLAFGKVRYIETLSGVDTEVFVAYGGNVYERIDQSGDKLRVENPEQIAIDYSAYLYHDEQGKLSVVTKSGYSYDLGIVATYKANRNLSTIVTYVVVDGGYQMNILNGWEKQSVELVLPACEEVCISDNGKHVAFASQTNLYQIDNSGRYHLLLENAGEGLCCHYVNNNGDIVYSYNNNGIRETYLYRDGATVLLCGEITKLVYYENLNVCLMVCANQNLVYVDCGETVSAEIYEDILVDELYDLAGNQLMNNRGNVGTGYAVDGCTFSYSEMPQVIVKAQGSTWFMTPKKSTEWTKLAENDEVVSNVSVWNHPKLYYVLNQNLYCLVSKEDTASGQLDWNDKYLVYYNSDGNYDVLMDGNLLVLDSGVLYSYDEKDGLVTLFKDVEQYASNDVSPGFTYVSDGGMYYCHCTESQSSELLCEVGKVDKLVMSNNNIYVMTPDNPVRKMSTTDDILTGVGVLSFNGEFYVIQKEMGSTESQLMKENTGKK